MSDREGRDKDDPDALLESLFAEPEAPLPRAKRERTVTKPGLSEHAPTPDGAAPESVPPQGRKLHEPALRTYPPDEVTVSRYSAPPEVTDYLPSADSWDDPVEQNHSDVDQLLAESAPLPAATTKHPSARPTRPVAGDEQPAAPRTVDPLATPLPIQSVDTPLVPPPRTDLKSDAGKFVSDHPPLPKLVEGDHDEPTRFFTKEQLLEGIRQTLTEHLSSVPPPPPLPTSPAPPLPTPAARRSLPPDEPTSFFERDALRRLQHESSHDEEATAFYNRDVLRQQLLEARSRTNPPPKPPEPGEDEPTQSYDRSELLAARARKAATAAEQLDQLSTDEFEEVSSEREHWTGSAAEYLGQTNKLEEWAARAEWMESEARSAADPQSKARALLVASELWAMTGQLRRARDVASVAAAIAPSMPLATRQLRWLAAADGGDYKTVSASLEGELRASPTAEARLHAALLSSELHRIVFRDENAAHKKLEVAARAAPQDPRPHVTRVLKQLATSAAPPKLRLPEGSLYDVLGRALGHVVRRRGGSAETGEAAPLDVSFEQARRDLAQHNLRDAGEQIARLASDPDLQRGALWLASALFAPEPSARKRAFELLSSLLRVERGAALERAFAARALELGDREALHEVLNLEPVTHAIDEDGPESGPDEPFSPADRVALAALTGISLEEAEPWLLALRQGTGASALADAFTAAHGREPEQRPAAARLGAALAGLSPRSATFAALEQALAQYRPEPPNEPLVHALELEIAVEHRSAPRVAEGIATWSAEDLSEHDAGLRHLAAALAAELGGDAEAADREYTLALGALEEHEGATRALLQRAPKEVAAERLEAAAEAGTDPTHAALLLIEAALRRGPDDADAFERLITRAAELADALPFSYRLGELLARSRGDATALLKWVRRRRDAASDPVERALDLVREALLVAEENGEAAASLLDQASLARASDVGLQELLERLATPAEATRAAWRESVASEIADPSAKRALLVAAAVEYERALDPRNAERVAQAAVTAGESGVGKVLSERLAAAEGTSSALAERLLADARAEQDPLAQRELYERLSALAEERRDSAASLLWQHAILERSPDHLPALRRLQQAHLSAPKPQELLQITRALAMHLHGAEGRAHAQLGARLHLLAGERERALEMVELAGKERPRPLWVLRELLAEALLARNDARLLELCLELLERPHRPSDTATLSLRAAEAALRLNQPERAAELLQRAHELLPEHPIVLARRAELFALQGAHSAEAETLEAIAQSSRVSAHALDAWYAAGVCWLERASDTARARTAFERAAELDVAHDQVFERLRAIYVADGDRAKLAELIERRLHVTNAPEQRVLLEVARGRALAEMGDRAAARAALGAALEGDPEHAEALEAMSELSMLESDWASAEDALIRLARQPADDARQAQIYRRLGELYDRELPNPERAELAYREVLKRQPDDLAAAERLVLTYGRLGQQQRAVELVNELLSRAQTPEQKRDRTLLLARVYEQVLGDRRQAEATLEKARKSWSQDAEVLRALVQFYERAGEDRAIHVLLDRSTGEARRALATGRFEPAFFRTLSVVAELRGAADAADVARATLRTLEGHPGALPGLDDEAAQPRFDELLAPELLSLPMRALLRRTGNALDHAFAPDMRALRLAPMRVSHPELAEELQQYAAAFGAEQIETFSSPVIGFNCIPLATEPAAIALGSPLIVSEDAAVRRFLVLRALKVVQARASALARAAAIDLWPMMAAYLGLFASHWQAQGVDAKKLAEAQQRLRAALPPQLEPDTASLALEVIGSLGNRASQLGTAVQQWGSRTALLAIGDLSVCFRALSLSGAHGKPLPRDPAELVKWVVRSAEARDLAIFSVSEQYTEARARHFGAMP